MKAHCTRGAKRVAFYLNWHTWMIGYSWGLYYSSARLGPLSVVWASRHVQELQ